MPSTQEQIAFGPVPSRRLGRSLGVNNIPPKNCSYGCVYCQVGPTPETSLERKSFYPAHAVVEVVSKRVRDLRDRGEKIDYLTFAPDGEPTLDIELGSMIKGLKPLGIPIAVITNASLLALPEVQTDLSFADLVSIKIDTVSKMRWRKINQPHPSLQLSEILEGIQIFSSVYDGKLISETMLIRNANDDLGELEETAEFLSTLTLHHAYLCMPTRPTSQTGIRPATRPRAGEALEIFAQYLASKVSLTGLEGSQIGSTGNFEADLLGAASVHPLKQDVVENLIRKCGTNWSALAKLLETRQLKEVEHEGEKYYVRKFE